VLQIRYLFKQDASQKQSAFCSILLLIGYSLKAPLMLLLIGAVIPLWHSSAIPGDVLAILFIVLSTGLMSFFQKGMRVGCRKAAIDDPLKAL